MSLIPLSPPVAEPVSVTGAKARLRAGSDLDDAAVSHWIQAARERVERDTGRALLSQAWRERRDEWGGDGRLTAFASRFRLMKPPLIALDAVRIFSADGTPSEIDPAAFVRSFEASCLGALLCAQQVRRTRLWLSRLDAAMATARDLERLGRQGLACTARSLHCW